jgi:hypothetical protein
MSNVINTCGKRKCCPKIRMFTDEDKYVIFDEEAGWKTGKITRQQMKNIAKAINKMF